MFDILELCTNLKLVNLMMAVIKAENVSLLKYLSYFSTASGACVLSYSSPNIQCFHCIIATPKNS